MLKSLWKGLTSPRRSCRKRGLNHRPLRIGVEPLEARRLLSIVWDNRGIDDDFEDVYGDDEDIARAIVDRAFADWNRLIDLNWDDDHDPDTSPQNGDLTIDVYAANLGGARGMTSNIEFDAPRDGRPSAADITLDDNGGGAGWHFGVDDDYLFSTLATPFHGTIPNSGDDNDFYRTTAHEIGHAAGLLTNVGEAAISDFLVLRGEDQVDGWSDLFLFHNANGEFGIQATLTENGGGHFYEGPADPEYPNDPIHPHELLNAGRTVSPPPTTRQLVSDLLVEVLADAYDYDVTLPSDVDTLYVARDATDQQNRHLVVRGLEGSSNDSFTITRVGNNVKVEVNGTEELVAFGDVDSIVITGGDGNDTMYFVLTNGDPIPPQNASFDGGSGTDTIKATGSGSFTLANASLTTPSGTISLTSIEKGYLVGGSSADTLDASGFSGQVTLYGGSGADLLKGGSANDTIYGEAANDTIYGNGGADYILGGDGDDEIHGDAGNDSIFGNSGNDTLYGDADPDYIRGDNGYVEAYKGHDCIFGGTGNDSLYGDGGNDTITGDADQDYILGDWGYFNDWYASYGYAPYGGNDSLLGGTGSDTIRGELLGDTISGQDGHDLCYGDFAWYGGYGYGEYGYLAYGGNDLITGGLDNDTLCGEQFADTVQGDGGTDLAYGDDGQGGTYYSGNDSMDGGAEADSLYGEAGNDTIAGGSGTDRIEGGTGNDSLSGDAGDDSLYGQSGNDTVLGGSENDRLEGGDGSDSLDGGTENDTYVFSGSTNLGTDTINEAAGAGTDALDFTSFGHAITLDLTQVGTTQTVSSGYLSLRIANDNAIENVKGSAYADYIKGNSLGNTIYGGNGNDSIYGMDGADMLYGEGNNDRLEGGLGNDSLEGGIGDDTFVFAGSSNLGTDTVNEASGAGTDMLDFGSLGQKIDELKLAQTGSTQTVASGLLSLYLVNETIENVTGTAFADKITGNSLSNVIYGGAGDDSLYGGSGGNDSLYGEAGNDYLDVGDGVGGDYVNGGTGTNTVVYDQGDTVV